MATTEPQATGVQPEVRGDAEALVDAFGIPDQVLRAPIGLRDPA